LLSFNHEETAMSLSTLSRILKIALLAIPLAMMSSPGEARTICPLFLIKYCALIHGHQSTIWTNPCLARQEGIRLLHAGACKGHHC
jgi:hypothetical protein